MIFVSADRTNICMYNYLETQIIEPSVSVTPLKFIQILFVYTDSMPVPCEL